MRRPIMTFAVFAATAIACGCGSSSDSPGTSSGATGGGGTGGKSGSAGTSGGGTGGGGGSGGAQVTCNKPGDMPFEWAKPISKESAGIAGMALGSDDAIYLTGLFSSKVTLGVGQPGETVLTGLLTSRDAFFAKLAPDGTLAWAKRAGGTADDAGFDVAVASDGLRVVGSFEGTGLFGPGEPGETQLQATGEADLFVAKLNGDGTLAWVKRAGAATNGSGTFGSALARSAGNGSLRVLGAFNGQVTFGPGEANETQFLSTTLPAGGMFLASYAADGSLEWVKRVVGGQLGGGSVLSGRGADLRVAPDGTALVVVGGNVTFAPGEASETTLNGSGINVGRYDAAGALLDAKAAGGGGRLGSAALGSDGSLYVGGMFNDTITFASGQPNQTALTAAAFPDAAEVFVAKLAPEGSFLWAKEATVGTKGALGGLGVAPDGTFRLLVQYFGQAMLGPGELGAVQLTAGSCLIANYGADGKVISAKDVSRWHSAMNLPPAPPFARTLAVSASDGSLRVVGFTGTSDPITLGEKEPSATVIDDVSSFIAKYRTCP